MIVGDYGKEKVMRKGIHTATGQRCTSRHVNSISLRAQPSTVAMLVAGFLTVCAAPAFAQQSQAVEPRRADPMSVRPIEGNAVGSYEPTAVQHQFDDQGDQWPRHRGKW